MKFVVHTFGSQLLVQLGRSNLKSIVVRIATIDVDGWSFYLDSVMGFDEWQKFADEEVVVAIMPIGRIDEEGAATFGRGHDEVTGFVLARQLFNQAPPAAAHKRLLVLAEPVQEIEHGIFLGFLLITRGEHHTIAHRAVQHMALDAGAINAALGGCKPGTRKYCN